MKMIINVVALMIGSWFVTPPADVPVHIDLKEENSETSFAKYLSMFPLKDEPINIGFADIEEFNDELNSINKIFGKKPLEYNTLNKYLPHEAVRMFSRRSSNREVFPLARVYIDNERLAVVYVSVAGQGPVFYKNTKFSYKNDCSYILHCPKRKPPTSYKLIGGLNLFLTNGNTIGNYLFIIYSHLRFASPLRFRKLL